MNLNFKYNDGYWLNTDRSDLATPICKSEAKTFLRKKGFFLQRLYGPLRTDSIDENEFYIVYLPKNKFIQLENLSKKTRSSVRKALNLVTYERTSREQLLNDGAYKLYKKASSHYKVSNYIFSENEFIDRIMNSLNLSENYDYWGAYNKETNALIGYSIVRKYQNVASFEVSKGDPDYLNSHRVMYGLYYTRNEFYLNNLGFDYVITGNKTLTDHSNIQEFMIKNFSFEKGFCNVQIFYSNFLAIIIYIVYNLRFFLKMVKSNHKVFRIAKALVKLEKLRKL